VVESEFKETKLLLLPNKGAEQSPDEWWNAILDTAKRVLLEKPRYPWQMWWP